MTRRSKLLGSKVPLKIASYENKRQNCFLNVSNIHERVFRFAQSESCYFC